MSPALAGRLSTTAPPGKPRKWFLEMKSIPGKDALKTVEMLTRDLEYCINIVDKSAAGFERIGSNSERSSHEGKMVSNSIACYREIVCERKSIYVANFIVVLF